MNLRQLAFGADPLTSAAAWLWQMAGERAEALAQMTIYVPNRRSEQALSTALLTASGKPVLALPRILPLGDVEHDALLAALPNTKDLPPAMPPALRRALLWRPVEAWLGAEAGGYAERHDLLLRLVEQLSELIEQLAREGTSLAGFRWLQDEPMAQHWQRTRRFLEIIDQHWPAMLAEQGMMDAPRRTARMVEAQIQLWQASPPEAPVVVVGSTGSIPSTRRLMLAVAALPQGYLLLPPLMPWKRGMETHPMQALGSLLEELGVSIDAIPSLGMPSIPPERRSIAEAVFAPADVPMCAFKDSAGIWLVEAEHPTEEAALIGLILRDAVEQSPNHSAALVTGDATLARRVVAELLLHGVAVDDATGYPLAEEPIGQLFMLALDLALTEASPLALASLMDHPDAMPLGDATARAMRDLEKNMLRQRMGISSLTDMQQREKRAKLGDGLAMIRWLEGALAPWQNTKPKPLGWWLDQHRRLVRLCCGRVDDDLPAPLEEALQQLEATEHAMGAMDGTSYATLIRHHLQQTTVQHPPMAGARVKIMGTLEARLSRFDRVVVGGMNEGVWPATPQASPWMNRRMLAACGLPMPERAIGMAAHDVLRLLEMPEIFLTRARMDGTSPTTPSRWWERICAMTASVDVSEQWRGWLRLLRPEPEHQPATPPRPAPAVEERPENISATGIELLQHAPYVWYAKHMLKLVPQDALGSLPHQGDYGNLMHAVLESYSHWRDTAEAASVEQFLAIARQKLKQLPLPPELEQRWQQRLTHLAPSTVAKEETRRNLAAQVVCEASGSMELATASGRNIRITARADRLEVMPDGFVTVVDYKTGTPPREKDVLEGRALQLAVEALIISQSGFADVGNHVRALHYWPLKYRPADAVGKSRDVAVSQGFLEDTRERVEAVINRYLASTAAFTLPLQDGKSGGYAKYDVAYDHLARRG